MAEVPEAHSGWTFVTNHARVLAAIADNPNARIRDIAAHCRLTERAVQRIISDLEQDGYLSHTRDGRTNTYRIEPEKVLRHPAGIRSPGECSRRRMAHRCAVGKKLVTCAWRV